MLHKNKMHLQFGAHTFIFLGTPTSFIVFAVSLSLHTHSFIHLLCIWHAIMHFIITNFLQPSSCSFSIFCCHSILVPGISQTFPNSFSKNICVFVELESEHKLKWSVHAHKFESLSNTAKYLSCAARKSYINWCMDNSAQTKVINCSMQCQDMRKRETSDWICTKHHHLYERFIDEVQFTALCSHLAHCVCRLCLTCSSFFHFSCMRFFFALPLPISAFFIPFCSIHLNWIYDCRSSSGSDWQFFLSTIWKGWTGARIGEKISS